MADTTDDFMKALEENGGKLVIRGELGVLRRAKVLALQDGRAWEDLPAETMDRYIDLAKAERSAPTPSEGRKP